MMQVATIRWHVYDLTSSTIALGGIGLSRFVPIVLFSLIGGTVADAFDRRRVLFVTQTMLALGALTLGLLTQFGVVTAASIYAVSFISATAIAFDNPARQSLVPNLVQRKHFPNAASLNSIAMQLASITGPVIAGLLIGVRALASIYYINALSFAAVIVALYYVRPLPGAGADKMSAANGDAKVVANLEALREGLRFVRQTPILVWTIALDFLATFFASADALLPAVARDVLHVGPRGYGLLTAAEAIGSLTAGAIMALRGTVQRQGRTVLWAVAAFGAATVLFGASRVFWLSWLAYTAIGASDTVSTILRQTIRQLITPDHLRGRMTAVNMVFFMGGPQLGNLESGILAQYLGAPWSVITGGIGCMLAAAWIAARSPSLRSYMAQEHRHSDGN